MELNSWTVKDKPVVVEDVLGGSVPVVAGNNLLVFKLGHVPVEGIYEGASSRIYVYSFDGKLVNTVELPKNRLFKLNSSVAFEQTSVYVVLEEYVAGAEGPELKNEYLCKVDLENGKIEDLEALGAEQSHSIVGVYPAGILMLGINETFSIIDEGKQRVQSQTDLSVDMFSLTEQKTYAAKQAWVNGKRSCTFDDKGNMYFFENGSTSLQVCDLLTGKTTTFVKDVNIT